MFVSEHRFAGAFVVAWFGASLCLAFGCERVEEPELLQPPLRVQPESEPHSSEAPAKAHEPLVEIELVQGDVRWRRAAAAAWSKAREAQTLRPRDAIQTMETGRAMLLFLDNLVTGRLGANTTLVIRERRERTTRLEHKSGRFLAKVRSGGETTELEVEIPPGTLHIRSAKAAPGREDDGDPVIEAHLDVREVETTVAMARGVGELRPRSGEAVHIDEEQYVEVNREGEVIRSGFMDPFVELRSPEDGGLVRTRAKVRFVWEAVEGVDGYTLLVRPESGPPVVTRMKGAANSASVELEAGRYLWTVRADIEGREGRILVPRVVRVEVDRVPPRLLLKSPSPGERTESAAVSVVGTTEAGARVFVDGRPLPIRAGGAFSTTTPVSVGLSNVVVRAVDDCGNRTTLVRSVLRE